MTDNPFGGWMQESDHAQSRRLRELTDDVDRMRSSLSHQHRTAAAMRSDLASLRGSIETRLARLSEAFDAFVELSSLRDQLSLVAGPALVRQATRARLVALGTTTGDDGPVLDVAGAPAAPGYWLADALGALGPDDASAADRGAAIDRGRTATFLTVAGAACGRVDLVARWSSDALGTLDPAYPVTRAQRAVWVAAAEGRLGPDARDVLLTRLRAAVDALPAATVEQTVAAWTDQVRQTAGRGAAAARTSDPGASLVAQMQQATTALRALGALLDGRDATTPTLDADADAAADATVDELVAVLRSLVDEGAEEEHVLMTRIAELEAVVTGSSAPGPAWNAPAGDLLTLLREDALTRHDPTGAVARDASAPWWVTIADTYLRDADVPPPDHLEATALGVTLRARPTGPVDGQDEALVNARTPQHPRTRRETWVTTGCAVGAALFWLATAVDGSDLRWLSAIVAGALTIAAVARVAGRVQRSRQDAVRATRSVEFVEREAQRLQARVGDVVRAVETGRQDAHAAHGHVVAASRRATPGTPVDA
ncbi:hypothetical protein [Cellulomonas sp. S1-8]|uniref:hypothetical protein n=1 Tax=Cellulomonas sp. S1-8 TaxID=2904790 RepID=UPI002243DC1B|nr:hypothetical protein [Cellulomonas sp. S1-8]UZN04127.1 hypothetical protein OKX07_04100 [Cellulomonas sp. S1-8]